MRPNEPVAELRDPKAVERWLAAGLCLGRLGRPTVEGLARAATWLGAALEQGSALPPPGLLVDLGELLEGRPMDARAAFDPTAAGPLRQALRGYEDHLLGRLAGDRRRFEGIVDATARHHGSVRAFAPVVLAEHLVATLAPEAALAVNVAAARRLVSRPPAEVLELGLSALRRLATAPTAEAAALAGAYGALARGARHQGRLLGDRDVFVLENLDVLTSPSRRLAIAQMVEAAEALERPLPKRLRRKSKGHSGAAPTAIMEEDLYPIGGYSSLSTSAELENLVCSELVYMDDDSDSSGGDGDGVDLFDVRFAEGQLLHYSRDENLLLRRRRAISLVLAGDLAHARFKDPELPYQRLVLLCGLLRCAVRRLSSWLGDEQLLLKVRFLAGPRRSRDPLAEERPLLRLLLREWLELGQVTIDEAPVKPQQVLADAAEDARTALADLVFFSAGTRSARLELPERRSLFRWARVDLGGPTPGLTLQGARATAEQPSAPDAWQAWLAATRALLEHVI